MRWSAPYGRVGYVSIHRKHVCASPKYPHKKKTCDPAGTGQSKETALVYYDGPYSLNCVWQRIQIHQKPDAAARKEGGIAKVTNSMAVVPNSRALGMVFNVIVQLNGLKENAVNESHTTIQQVVAGVGRRVTKKKISQLEPTLHVCVNSEQPSIHNCFEKQSKIKCCTYGKTTLP